MESRAGKRTEIQAGKFDLQIFLASMGPGQSTEERPPKQNIFRQGDPADGVFFIESGKVELKVTSPQGKEGVVGMLVAGDFFGEGCLAGQPLRMSSARTLAESVLSRIDKKTMVRVLRQEPALSRMFTAFLLSRNIRFEEDLVDHLFNSSERRLARVLLLLTNFGKEGEMQVVIPAVNQDVLAARVGTTRSRINFFMNKFRKLGLIEYNGHLKVHSALLNVVLHD
jgi:CRP-like cAMP-binding protein